MSGDGTRESPWELTTAPGTSAYTMWRDESADPPALVCQVGSTTLRYHLRAIEDLHAKLRERGDWVDLGAADKKKPARDGSIEAWGRADDTPSGAGTACATATAAASACTSRPCSRSWGSSSWSASRATTGPARSDVGRASRTGSPPHLRRMTVVVGRGYLAV